MAVVPQKRALPVENKAPILDYAPPAQGRGHGMTSVWIAVVTVAFVALVLLRGDPFGSMGNEKAVRVSVVAGVLGGLVAVRDMIKRKCSKPPLVGLVLNVIAILGALILLPYS